jgi:acyl-CoA reductase-like NAD-dependent aldehyde dehydrogenase
MSEVIDFINAKPKPLAVYFFGKPHHKDSTELRYKTSSGCFMTNECLMQCISHYQAFGGVGESGQGRYGGYEGFKQFSNPKSMLIKGPVPKMARDNVMPPYTD